MSPLRIICLLMGILALTSASNVHTSPRRRYGGNSIKNSFKATDWLSVSELESLPSMKEITVEKLEEMTLHEGAEWIRKLYHLSQAGYSLEANYLPKLSEINCIYIDSDNKKVTFKLTDLPKIAQEEQNFGNQEVTIYITGLPEKSETVKKSTRKLIQAYMQRYNGRTPKPYDFKIDVYSDSEKREGDSTSSEENSDNNKNNEPLGKLIVIELGNVITDMYQSAILDVESLGMEIGDLLVQFTDRANVPHEVVHVIGCGIGAHVAGATGRQFIRKTGHQLRRITGLNPTNLFAGTDKALKGLARGDAEFVDAIHTSAYGMGTVNRCGDVDFYPNGPSDGVPGADNVVEAAMRAVRYFAESVIPGNERNFPAVCATSLQLYKDLNGHGKRIYMGINTDYDLKGDFILQVNAKSPFGQGLKAQKQKNYHIIHKPWKTA